MPEKGFFTTRYIRHYSTGVHHILLDADINAASVVTSSLKDTVRSINFELSLSPCKYKIKAHVLPDDRPLVSPDTTPLFAYNFKFAFLHYTPDISQRFSGYQFI